MEKNIWSLLAVVTLTAGLAAGCGSSSESDDGGGDAGQNNDTSTPDAGTDGPVTFGLTPGTYCYNINKIEPGASDLCEFGAADSVGMDAIPGNYDLATGIFKLGREGSLGQGTISHNVGTLKRDGMPFDPAMTTCIWKEVVETGIVMIAENEFTADVNAKQSTFATACTAPPTGGMCTSTFKWTLKITGGKTVQADGNCK